VLMPAGVVANPRGEIRPSRSPSSSKLSNPVAFGVDEEEDGDDDDDDAADVDESGCLAVRNPSLLVTTDR